MRHLLTTLAFLSLFLIQAVSADEMHLKKSQKKIPSKEKEHAEHEEHEGEDKAESPHEHDSKEARGNVGPNKGVLEADEHRGFKLNPKAVKNFSVQSMLISKGGPVVVPSSALVFSGMEKQVFRSRGGYWKSVDIRIIKRSSREATVESQGLAKGDSIAIAGVGFLKIVEQSVFDPAIEGHVH